MPERPAMRVYATAPRSSNPLKPITTNAIAMLHDVARGSPRRLGQLSTEEEGNA
jgi:hypothetical protein